MIWVILAALAGLLIGAGMSQPLLKVAAPRARWTAPDVPDLHGAVASGAVVLAGIAVLFLSFGPIVRVAGALAGAVGGVVWSGLNRSQESRPWMRAAQGAGVGVVAVPLALGLALAAASLGGPLSGKPDVWASLVGDRAFPAWAACARSGNREYRLQALQLLRRCGPRANPLYRAALADEDSRVRVTALERLAELGGADLGLVLPMIEDSAPEVRGQAAAVLRALGDPRATRALLEAAGKSANTAEARSFTDAARKLPGAVNAARECVMGRGEWAGNENIRYGSVLAIDAFVEMTAADVQPVLKAMSDPSPRIRSAALDACRSLLRQSRDSDARFYASLAGTDTVTSETMEPLDFDPDDLIVAAARLLGDQDPGVRRMAAVWVPGICEGGVTINNVKSPRAGDPDSRSPPAPKARLVPILLRLLRSPDREAAGAAAMGLAFLGDRRALPVLRERDAAESSPYNCRYCAALEALGIGPLAHSTTFPGAPQ